LKSRKPIFILPVIPSVTEAESCVPPFGGARNRFLLFTEGDALYDAMLAAIGGASRQILLESYLFAADEVGQRFVAALSERARTGVEVRLMLDAVGSLLRFPRGVERRLREDGVMVRRFHRWRWRQPLRYNRRDHRKLLVVDGETAFVGGFNIHRESSRRACGEARWRDTHVQVRGELAVQARALFEVFWRGERRLPVPPVDAATVLLSNHTRGCRQDLGCLFNAVFDGAHTSLALTTPYFVPSRRMRQALRRAAQRGVKVRLLVPRVSDVRLARWAASAVYGELLQSGVQVFEYLPRMLHAKTVVADGDWALVGTANLDYRSVFVNTELIVASRDPALCQALQEQFEVDVAAAAEVEAAHWSRRRWPLRVVEWLAWSLRRWL
jgi:cardiolipin synthase A/B